MHEIVTLQLGERSNYIATHFWNLQESYFTYNEDSDHLIDHDVHFRPGLGADGTETFTPRTVIYDLKGGFGALRKYNALYEVEDSSGVLRGLWDGNQVVQTQPNIPQSEYQKNLDTGVQPPDLTSDSVRYWSDFNRIFYHPRSIVQLNEYELNSSLMPFEHWSAGEDLFGDLDKEHDLLDRDIRPFMEECDQIRALQIFTGSDDAWGGFAARYADRLRDEYGKTGIWVWAIEDGAKVPRQKQMSKMVNTAKTLNSISPLSTLYCPIIDSPPTLPSYLTVDFKSEWSKAALIASAVETVTLPARLRPHHDFESSLMGHSGGTQTIFELQSSMIRRDSNKRPRWVTYEDDLSGLDEDVKLDFDLNFTIPKAMTDGTTVFTQAQVFRGRKEEFAHDATSAVEDIGLARKMRFYTSKPALKRFSTTLRFPLPDSYPRNLFSDYDAETGVELYTALSSTSRIGDKLKDLQTIASRMVGVEERETLTNGLGELREAYEKGWMSETDSDDD
ncbi:putative mtDNA inheritance protein Dml1 [Talaromyces proteolyticus]|uniref:Protein DML1 n=1 Tax=Talaromyces proteolyticus TaxID=1131652 RepID=A0AAD4KTE4_9EURO|nr:putative mtDNA inheritance protein Dml1 [Talaromyces proteolyticus]KAH8698882.1 putative mtDNA inheritance protein Dml1 [Talaromyces proteolyticus]